MPEFDRSVDVVDAHSAGQPVRVVGGDVGLDALEGDSVAEKRGQFRSEYDHLRRFVNNEPRGHDNLVAAFPVEPTTDDADLGVIFTDNRGYLDMCGDGSIRLVTTLVEAGRLPADELTIETPIGPVDVSVDADADEGVERVTVHDVPAFVYGRTTVGVDGSIGRVDVPCTLAYAGHYYALVDADEVAIDLDLFRDRFRSEAAVEYGMRLREALDERGVRNPLTGESSSIAVTMFYREFDDRTDRNVIVYGDGAVGRAPCGTGTCARMASLHERGDLDLGEPYPSASVLGTEYVGRLVNSESRGEIELYVAEVSGRAFVTGRTELVRHGADTLDGYRYG